MYAVDEQRKYGENEFIVYKKMDKQLIMSAPQDEEKIHYSIGIPSKNPENYELFKTFSSFAKMKNWISKNYKMDIDKEQFFDKNSRDIFGDYVCKIKASDFDLAIRESGDFLLYFDSECTNEVRKLIKARDIWDQFVEGNYKTAEPGLIFWSTMSKYSPSNYVGRPIICTNPCAEVPLEDGGACNLGSLNLSRFVNNGYSSNAEINWDGLAESTSILLRFLDNVVTWNEDLNALEKQKLAAKETRRLGLGVMGIADMLNQLGIGYDSDQGISIISKVMEFITNVAYQASASLAAEKGASPIYDEDKYMECPFIDEALSDETIKIIQDNGLRNIAIMSIAPTGSISNIVLSYKTDEKNYIGVSSGVEPIFAIFYNRRSESFNNKFYKVFHSSVQAYIDIMGINDQIEDAEDLNGILPDYMMRTAHAIDSVKRVEIQGLIQKYIDHSISSTINLPEDVNPELISDIYIKAWKNKLKGLTIYRDGSRLPILSVEGKTTEFQKNKIKKYTITNENNEKIEISGDEIIKMPDGSLTTIYHFLKNSNMKIEELITSGQFQEMI